jgi:hypothetical protein
MIRVAATNDSSARPFPERFMGPKPQSLREHCLFFAFFCTQILPVATTNSPDELCLRHQAYGHVVMSLMAGHSMVQRPLL